MPSSPHSSSVRSFFSDKKKIDVVMPQEVGSATVCRKKKTGPSPPLGVLSTAAAAVFRTFRPFVGAHKRCVGTCETCTYYIGTVHHVKRTLPSSEERTINTFTTHLFLAAVPRKMMTTGSFACTTECHVSAVSSANNMIVRTCERAIPR